MPHRLHQCQSQESRVLHEDQNQERNQRWRSRRSIISWWQIIWKRQEREWGKRGPRLGLGVGWGWGRGVHWITGGGQTEEEVGLRRGRRSDSGPTDGGSRWAGRGDQAGRQGLPGTWTLAASNLHLPFGAQRSQHGIVKVPVGGLLGRRRGLSPRRGSRVPVSARDEGAGRGGQDGGLLALFICL